ncbi:DUF3231 family protein [Geodermatophilus chilensis]|uniref:DUF3231 family protein n=1 Tax=Geodermatophilus chilensis TaxID=2035835 RepID=UPI000C25ECF9|nr:DUF3231 family protein [Geodermatophilus chilensis]
MSGVQIGQPEGRTDYTDKPASIYQEQVTQDGALSIAEYAQVVNGYLREWVCMGQCNIYIATAQDQDLKDLISLYLKDVCDPNVEEMRVLLERGGYPVPIELDQAPTSTDPVQIDAIDDTTIALGQWFATRAFMELWHTGAMASDHADVRDAFIRNYHRANRWHVAYHAIATEKGFLKPLPTMDPALA